MMPGGLGSTHKVLILGKGVGTPALRGCSFRSARHVSDTKDTPGPWCPVMDTSDPGWRGIMVFSEAATLAKIEPFWSWNTPICWTGFILFADAIVYRARGNSWIRSNPREFAVLALASIPLWLVFEGFNLYLDNWYYVGLPENRGCGCSATPGRLRRSGRRSSRARSWRR